MHVYLGKRWVFGLVWGESCRVVVRVSRDTQPPTILAKSPAKSLLLITRQREYHGQGILLFIMMWFISLEPLGSVFPPPRFPCIHALPLLLFPSRFISLLWWHLLSRFVSHLLSSRRECVFRPLSIPSSFRRILFTRQNSRNRINMQIFTCQGVENCQTSRCVVHIWEMWFRKCESCCVLNLVAIFS